MKNIIVLFLLFLSITISAQGKKDYVTLESEDLRIDKVDESVNKCLKTDVRKFDTGDERLLLRWHCKNGFTSEYRL